MKSPTQILIQNCIDSWNSYLTRTDKLFAELSEDQLQKEVAPGRNTGVYLLGHLAAVNDNLFPLLGIGEKLHPEMADIFLHNPDKSGLKKPGVDELRTYWQEVNKKLSSHLARFTPEDWLQKHTSVSEADFQKEPHRNRLNVIINRTGHLAYHFGQLVFLKNR